MLLGPARRVDGRELLPALAAPALFAWLQAAHLIEVLAIWLELECLSFKRNGPNKAWFAEQPKRRPQLVGYPKPLSKLGPNLKTNQPKGTKTGIRRTRFIRTNQVEPAKIAKCGQICLCVCVKIGGPLNGGCHRGPFHPNLPNLYRCICIYIYIYM